MGLDPESRAEINRRYYEKNKEDLKQKHRDYWKTYRRKSRAHTLPPDSDGRVPQQTGPRRTGHGPGIWAWISIAWDEQRGRCYLCGDPILLTPEPDQRRRTAQIDHDHQCCPTNKSCQGCRRGLACGQCNSVLGMVNDDLDRLELIARNARAAWKGPTAT